MSKREKRRLEAAEQVCRAVRKALSYHATSAPYWGMVLDWLLVWIDNAPKAVSNAEPVAVRRKRP